MKLTTLSHAGLAIESQGRQLICDPWLVGSCYWRSWWNYPPVVPELVATLHPSWIYLTHIHWDHFQGASLRLFSLDTPVLIPFDRYTRIHDDLAKIGFKTIIELKHGERHPLSDTMAITSYQFSPFTDSAVVIEADGVVVLNANDAKFMGGPLEQILADHPKIDFALRSHSSANARLTYHCLDAPDAAIDDNSSYALAFCAFMERVRPRYAIPFASNHCHLHKDTWAFNAHVTSPDVVAKALVDYQKQRPFPTELRIMTSGDSWDSASGFHITPSPWLLDREAGLAAYAETMRPVLEKTYRKEEGIVVSEAYAIRQLTAILEAVPFFWRWPFRGRPVLFDVRAGEVGRQGFLVDPWRKKVTVTDPAGADPMMMRIVIPASVFKMSLALRMFAHAAISKRLRFMAKREDMGRLSLFEGLLSWYEMEALPLGGMLTSKRFWQAYRPRWREILLIARMAVNRARGIPLRVQEIHLLRGGG
jgi:UDP-MurNAc hydroxylase